MFWRECQTKSVECPSIARLALVEDAHILGPEGLAVDAHLVNAAIKVLAGIAICSYFEAVKRGDSPEPVPSCEPSL